MARYDQNHKEQTRQRIIEASGHRLKIDGIDGSGVATLMKDAGLTNGAFYAHFSSKEDLVAQTIAAQLHAQRENLLAALRDDGFAAVVRGYLSLAHCSDVENGCPSAALVDEIARSSPSIKDVYTRGMVSLADEIAALLRPDDPSAVRARVLAAIAQLVGTLQLARALTDPQAVDELLEEASRTLLDEFET
jgi:TetR/AcrR family transcriptional regulator, transcriptional repressor for nem operon